MTAPSNALNAWFDTADPAFHDDPYRAYRELRERAPVAWLPEPELWLVTGWEEVRSLMRDPRLAAEVPPDPPLSPGGSHPFLRTREEARRLFPLFMLYRPPADHGRLRQLFQPAFAPARVRERRARIQDLTDEALERAAGRGRLDVVQELGRPIALAIAMDLAGIPEAMRSAVGKMASELFYRLEFGPNRERGLLAMAGLVPLLRRLIAEWRTRPPGDDNLLWRLEQARQEGAMSEDEVVAQGVLILLAGHATSQHLIGNGVLALLRHPDQWELLRERPELIQTAVEELVRYDGPARVADRMALDKVEVGGETIRRGDRVGLMVAAANRDPAAFRDPDRFDVTRSPNPHLGFGRGPHYCVGAALARLEAEVAIGTLVRRMPPPRLETESLEWEPSALVRGLTSLPLILR
jgi:cytochrome P450